MTLLIRLPWERSSTFKIRNIPVDVPDIYRITGVESVLFKRYICPINPVLVYQRIHSDSLPLDVWYHKLPATRLADGH